LVVDEAYIEFSDAESMVDLAIKHPRLLVLRTMSKAFGMASLRVGFAVGCAANIKAMLCGVDMYNINTFSQLIGRAMLERSEEVMPYIEGVKQDSKALHKDLKAIEGLKVFDCNSNFILVESPHAKAIYEALIKIKILVRNYSNNENILRISCGTPEENEKLLTCIKEVLNGEKE
jgi:histidinol-phosphate aminotransferase